MREFDKSMHRAKKRLNLKPGDIYESCSYQPVLCLGVDYKRDEVWGISLVDGTYPCSCSLVHCGVRKLSLKAAWQIKLCGPSDIEGRQKIPKSRRWWNASTEKESLRVRTVGPRSNAASNIAVDKDTPKATRPLP